MSSPAHHAVFGLRIGGLAANPWLEAAARCDWPELTVIQRHSPATAAGRPVAAAERDGARARARLLDGRALEVDVGRGLAVLSGATPVGDDALVHPYLGTIAALASRLLGRDVMHAGAFAHAGGAWAVMGQREAGKSTLLAALGARAPVLTDDVLVLDGADVFSGPRCVDLRAPLPDADAPLPLTRVRSASRWRATLAPVAARHRLSGWIYLAWGPHVEVRSIPPADRVHRLARQRMWPELAADPGAVLAAAALPALELTRPREWSAMATTIDVLLDAAAQAGDATLGRA